MQVLVLVLVAGISQVHKVSLLSYCTYISPHEGEKALAAGWGIRFGWVGPAYRIRTNSLQWPTAAVGSYRALGKAIKLGRCR